MKASAFADRKKAGGERRTIEKALEGSAAFEKRPRTPLSSNAHQKEQCQPPRSSGAQKRCFSRKSNFQHATTMSEDGPTLAEAAAGDTTSGGGGGGVFRRQRPGSAPVVTPLSRGPSSPLHRTTSQKYKETFNFVTFHSKINLRRKLRSKNSPFANFIDLRSDFGGSELASYTGPRWEGPLGVPPDQGFINDLQTFFVVRNGRLARKYLYKTLIEVEKLYRRRSAIMVELNIPEDARMNICGDIHGQLYDLIKIFKLQGPPSASNFYLFNGDIVDKGPHSIECLLLLFLYKLAYPDWVFINRGNHEAAMVNVRHGFQKELLQKYPQDMFLFEYIGEVFRWMPVAHLISRKIFVIHGGLPNMPDLTLEDIRQKK